MMIMLMPVIMKTITNAGDTNDVKANDIQATQKASTAATER